MTSAAPEQLSLDRLYPCPNCDGEGRELTADPDSNSRVLSYFPCRTCQGSGTVAFDPNDKSIPY